MSDMYVETVRKREDYLYVLRKTLPPWRWRENLDELVRLCPKYGIDEVCVIVDTGTFTHAYPDLDWLKDYQKILMQVKRELAEVGVAYSINPNVTQGHGDRGRNIYLKHPDWTMLTRADGTHAVDCACNISQGWRDYIRQQWTIYAETEPASIWMEDDLRTFGHGTVSIGCFCSEHIRRFNEKLGTSYTREEVAREVFAPGTPTELRKQWLMFLNEMTLEVLALCEKTIHSVSPNTVFGLMSSGPDCHVAEGRDWQAIYDIMSDHGTYPMLSRPPLGSYQESSLAGLCYTSNAINATRLALGNQCLEEGEIENFPYTGYAKTNTFMKLQNSVAIGAGNEAVTLNLYDHCGTPMEQTEDILQALASSKNYLVSLKRLVQPRGTDVGIGVYVHAQSGVHKVLEPGQDSLFSDTMRTMELFTTLGIAMTYRPSSATLLAGQAIRAASHEEILRILSGGVFIDAVAFKCLTEMGYTSLLGADLLEAFTLNTTYPIAGEHYYNTNFGGGTSHAFSMAIHGQHPLFTVMKPRESAEEITEFVDPDFQRLFPGTQAYVNELGGRIILFPLEIAGLSNGFKTPMRKQFILQLLTWISQGRIPMAVSGNRNLLPLRYDREGDSIAAVYNLSLDPIDDCTIQLALDRDIEAVHMLDYGETELRPWTAFTSEGRKLLIQVPKLTFDAPKYFRVIYKN